LKTGKEYEEAGSLPTAERVVCETYELKNHGAKILPIRLWVDYFEEKVLITQRAKGKIDRAIFLVSQPC
jgi:hypothetical protein